MPKKFEPNEAEAEEAHRMRLLRRAEGYANNALGFAKRFRWTVTKLYNYESGFRRVPRDAALEMLKAIPGFDPIWLWTGEERGLSFDLRRRIEEARLAEAIEQGSGDDCTAPPKRTAH